MLGSALVVVWVLLKLRNVGCCNFDEGVLQCNGDFAVCGGDCKFAFAGGLQLPGLILLKPTTTCGCFLLDAGRLCGRGSGAAGGGFAAFCVFSSSPGGGASASGGGYLADAENVGVFRVGHDGWQVRQEEQKDANKGAATDTTVSAVATMGANR